MVKDLVLQLNKAADCSNSRSKNIGILRYLDIVMCMIAYGASPNNYAMFEFDKLKSYQRKTYVTHRISENMIKKLNENKYRDLFENKLEFARVFKRYLKRDYISSQCTEKEFLNFVEAHKKLIYKPVDAAQANGIMVFDFTSKSSKEMMETYNKIKSGNLGIIEEWIDQHDELNDIYPDAVNCLRIITVNNNKKADLLTGGITFALKGQIANGSKESLIAPINMKTGIIDKPAATFGSQMYEKHPITHKQILNFKVPYWDAVVDMLNEAVQLIPQVRYVGWDIAITKTGPCLIEGNTSPGYRYYQIPAHMKDGIGNREIYEKYLRG